MRFHEDCWFKCHALSADDARRSLARIRATWRPRTGNLERFVLLGNHMPAPFPHLYETKLVRTEHSRGRIESEARAPIETSPPPQLDGDETAWSAEQLLLASLATCLQTTFEAFAARDGVRIQSYESRVSSAVERTSRGLVFTKFTIEVDLDTDDNERALATLADAERYCLIAQALRVPVEVVATARDDLRQAG